MTWWQSVVGVLGVTLVPLLTYLSGRSAARNSADANRTADWEAFTKRVDADNVALRKRLEALEATVGALRNELRESHRRSDDLSDELDDFRRYAIDLRSELQRQDPSLRLPAPPARIARHFHSP